MNYENYENLKTSIKAIFADDTEIAKGIKNLVNDYAEDFQATQQDVLFVTMKEFTEEYQTQSVLQFFHYLGSLERNKLADMLNFLELTRF